VQEPRWAQPGACIHPHMPFEYNVATRARNFLPEQALDRVQQGLPEGIREGATPLLISGEGPPDSGEPYLTG